MLAGFAIFLCGLVRTYHIDRAMTKTQAEEYIAKTTNEYMEWWIGLPVGSMSQLCSKIRFYSLILAQTLFMAFGSKQEAKIRALAKLRHAVSTL